MFTLMLILGAALAIDALLAADAKLAMKRADLTLDYVSRVTAVPVQRLSDQLNGKTPFTSFWRFFTGEMRDTAWLAEFIAIQGKRVDDGACWVQNSKLAPLLERIDFLLGGSAKPMAKATLTPVRKQEAS